MMYNEKSAVPFWHVLNLMRYSLRRILLLGLVLGGIFVLSNESMIPTKYESSSLIRVNFSEWVKAVFHTENVKLSTPLSFGKNDLLTRKNLKDMLKSFNSTGVASPPAENQRQSILERFFSRYRVQPKPYSLEDEITDLQSSILIQSDEDSPSSYRIKFRSSDPEYGSAVIDALIETFIKNKKAEMLMNSEEIIKSLQSQIKSIDQRLQGETKALTIATQSNPIMNEETEKSLDDMKKTLTDTRFLIKELESKEQILADMIQRESPMIPNRESGRVVDSSSLIQQKNLQLAELKIRYTDKHPDIASLEKEIERLQSQKPIQTDSMTHNGEYQRLRYELGVVKSNLSRARYQESELERMMKKGISATGSNIRSLLSLIDKLNMNKVALQTELVNEEIRHSIIQSNIVTLVKIVDRAFTISLLIKQRYILMTIGLLLGLAMSFTLYGFISYRYLNRIQSKYGELEEFPHHDRVVLKEMIVHEDQRQIEKVFSLISNTIPKDFAITTAEDVLHVYIASKRHSTFYNLVVYSSIAAGYSYLVYVILLSYFFQYFEMVK